MLLFSVNLDRSTTGAPGHFVFVCRRRCSFCVLKRVMGCLDLDVCLFIPTLYKVRRHNPLVWSFSVTGHSVSIFNYYEYKGLGRLTRRIK